MNAHARCLDLLDTNNKEVAIAVTCFSVGHLNDRWTIEWQRYCMRYLWGTSRLDVALQIAWYSMFLYWQRSNTCNSVNNDSESVWTNSYRLEIKHQSEDGVEIFHRSHNTVECDSCRYPKLTKYRHSKVALYMSQLLVL